MSEKLEEILAKMAEKSKQQQPQITSLLTDIQGMPGINDPIRVTVQPAAQDVAAVRADKVQRLAIGLRKSNKIKDFKHTKDSNIRTYIKKFDEEIKSLITWLGWKWNDMYLSPHLNTRAVSTASSVQVRSPINSKSSGGWKNYKKMLKPAMEIITQEDKYKYLKY